jgi:hypothetical protein
LKSREYSSLHLSKEVLQQLKALKTFLITKLNSSSGDEGGGGGSDDDDDDTDNISISDGDGGGDDAAATGDIIIIGDETKPDYVSIADELKKDIRMIGSSVQRKKCEENVYQEITSNIAELVIKVLEDPRLPFYKSVDDMDKAGVLPDYKTSVNKFYYRPGQKKLRYPSVFVSFYDKERMLKGLQVNWRGRGKESKEQLSFDFEGKYNDFTYEFKCIPAYFDIKG